MKCQFVMNGQTYFAPSKKEAKQFVKHWDSFFSRIHRIKTTWKFKHVEKAPDWVPKAVLLETGVEYKNDFKHSV